MSTRPRIEPAAPGTAADFVSVMQHAPTATAAFFDLYAEFWQRGVVPARLKEIVRLRNARVTDCGY
jgi:hypothetical protein